MNIERRKVAIACSVPTFLKKQTLVRASKTKTLSCFFQLLLGPDEICGVKAFGKRSMDLAECIARVGGIVLQLGQVIETEAKFKFKQFGLLLSRDFEAFRKIVLCLIQILI